MTRSFLRILTIGASILCAYTAAAGANLDGKWLLTHDPDGPVKEDWMLFRAGDVSLGDADGVYLTCPYEVVRDTVVLVCTVRGKERRVVFPASHDFSQISNPSGAVYTKQ